MEVKAFLNLPFSEEFKLLAGEGGINNEISGVNILDNPQAMDWLSPGELIVTSGYFFKDGPDALEKFLHSFNRLNISGICIKPQIYLTPLPPKLITLCNSMNIPLIEVPYGIAFSKIMTTVMNLLSNSATESFQMAMDINTKFMEYGLEGDDINFLRQKLEQLLDNPLIITNTDWTILSNTHSNAFTNYTKTANGLTYFDVTCMSEIPANLNKLKHPVNITFKDQSSGMILPVFFKDVSYGYIIVLQKDRPLLKKDYIALEYASFSVALKIVHQAEKERIENRVKRDFYRELLSGNMSINNLKSHDVEFDYDIPYSVFLFTVTPSNLKNQSPVQKKYDEDRLMRNILKITHKYNHPMGKNLHIFKQGAYFIGLVGYPITSEEKNTVKLVSFFKELTHFIQSSFPTDMLINIFVGSTHPIQTINQSYNEAINMIRFTHSDKSEIYFADHFFFESFFQTRISNNDAEEFIQHYLSKLIEHDQESDSNLLETLDIYIQHHQNLATASRQLFIHRNTLLYRIDKIEKLLNCDISDPSTTLNLSLALKFSKDYPLKKINSSI